MIAALTASLWAGALGLSTTRSSTHSDADGRAVPSRWATEEELLLLCEIVGRYEGTSVEAMLDGCIGRFDSKETDLLVRMSSASGRAVNWNVLLVDADDPDLVAHQLQPSISARGVGARVVALTLPVALPMTMSFETFCALWLIPGWADVLERPIPERKTLLADPAVRARLPDQAKQSRFASLVDFAGYTVGDVFSLENEAFRDRVVGELAAQRGVEPFQCVVEIASADDFRTVLWPAAAANRDVYWAMRKQVWERPDVLLGGSDADAHLDRQCGAIYPTRFLADCLRGRRLLPLEQAVRLLTSVPAQYFGLRDRGLLEVGMHADIVVFDPASVDALSPSLVHDLPSGAVRLTAGAIGIDRVLVNGVEAVVDGQVTSACSGAVLRSVATRCSGFDYE